MFHISIGGLELCLGSKSTKTPRGDGTEYNQPGPQPADIFGVEKCLELVVVPEN